MSNTQANEFIKTEKVKEVESIFNQMSDDELKNTFELLLDFVSNECIIDVLAGLADEDIENIIDGLENGVEK